MIVDLEGVWIFDNNLLRPMTLRDLTKMIFLLTTMRRCPGRSRVTWCTSRWTMSGPAREAQTHITPRHSDIRERAGNLTPRLIGHLAVVETSCSDLTSPIGQCTAAGISQGVRSHRLMEISGNRSDSPTTLFRYYAPKWNCGPTNLALYI